MTQKQSLRGNKQSTTIKSTSATTTTTLKKKDKIHLSLWLIPPGGEGTDDDENRVDDQHKHNVYKASTDMVNELAEQYNGPTFIPHVTIVGGIEVDSEEDAIRLSKKLKEGLSSHNNNSDDDTTITTTTTNTSTTIRSIECKFKSIGGIEGPCACWNQALILEMERSESYLKLCQVCRQLLGMEQQQPHQGLGGVVGEVGPHMSLYYGVPQNISDPSTIDLSRIFCKNDDDGDDGDDDGSGPTHHCSFQSHRVMLMKTDPSSVEGVPDWKTIVDINLSS